MAQTCCAPLDATATSIAPGPTLVIRPTESPRASTVANHASQCAPSSLVRRHESTLTESPLNIGSCTGCSPPTTIQDFLVQTLSSARFANRYSELMSGGPSSDGRTTAIRSCVGESENAM